jgi:hypothetical protein
MRAPVFWVQIAERGATTAALLRAAGALTAQQLQDPDQFPDQAALLSLLPPPALAPRTPAAAAAAARQEL